MAVSDALSSSQITSLIQQATAADEAPAGVLQAQENPIKAQVTALDQVQSSLSSLQSALGSLANIQMLAQRSVSVSPDGVVAATAGNAAQPGNYSLSGIYLAVAESLISSGSASASTSLGAGTLTIQVGGSTAVNINIGSGSSSLADIASAIDQSGAGIEASVVFDGSKYHLVLTGNGTGTANAFTVTGSGALSGLSYNPAASGLGLTRAASNASFSFDDITITSGSNTINGVVPGLSLTLTQSGSATVTVAQDSTALETAAQNLAGALNQVLGTINQNASYTQTSGGGPLFGNIGVEIIRSNLLDAVSSAPNAASELGSPYSALSSIGFGVTSGGTVTFNQAAFESAAQTNYSAVAALLGEIGQATHSGVSVESIGSAPPGSYPVNVTSNADGTIVGTINGEAASGTGGLLTVNDNGVVQGMSVQIAPGLTGALGSVTISQGVFAALSTLVNSAVASGSGSVTGQISNLNTTLIAMNKQVNSLLAEAQIESKQLTQQFSQAQATLSQLNTVSSFLSTFFKLTSGG